jgi:hypothetical protein
MPTDQRYFLVDQVYKTGQTNDTGKEVPTRGYEMLMKARTPMQAGKKALTALCKRKSYSGICALRIILIEVEGGETRPIKENGEYVPMMKSDGDFKTYAYRMQKRKLKVPREVEMNGKIVIYRYESKIRSDINKKYIARGANRTQMRLGGGKQMLRLGGGPKESMLRLGGGPKRPKESMLRLGGGPKRPKESMLQLGNAPKQHNGNVFHLGERINTNNSMFATNLPTNVQAAAKTRLPNNNIPTIFDLQAAAKTRLPNNKNNNKNKLRNMLLRVAEGEQDFNTNNMDMMKRYSNKNQDLQRMIQVLQSGKNLNETNMNGLNVMIDGITNKKLSNVDKKKLFQKLEKKLKPTKELKEAGPGFFARLFGNGTPEKPKKNVKNNKGNDSANFKKNVKNTNAFVNSQENFNKDERSKPKSNGFLGFGK